MPHGGKLTIETSNAYLDEDYCRRHADIRPGQYVLISVTDTGIGMPQSVIERVFEPFFTTKPAGSGTGLGLSQVYGFVKQSGGHVGIYSEVGQGTTVKLYLPRMRGAAPAKDESARPVAAVAGNGERILVVEDDDDVRSYVADALRALNYRVDEAADADHALGLIDTEKFDLLLTDVVLPGMNGRQLAEQAQFRQDNIRVLFMTGYSRNAIVRQGRLDPGIELLQKPITGGELAGKVRKMLDTPVPAPADPVMSG
jgi:CheY-like chemotaxis protein